MKTKVVQPVPRINRHRLRYRHRHSNRCGFLPKFGEKMVQWGNQGINRRSLKFFTTYHFFENKENNVFKDGIGVKGLRFKLHGNNHGNHLEHYGIHHDNHGNHHGVMITVHTGFK